ncbi:MAG: bifunctional nuclease family protein [Bacteroidetes bacterium]|nr:bifunctional nuclease family protein [Bacteroidota bacterium]MBU1717646.1 bifunctional nuclease family protein [Bacteroidota bacterium]
MEKIKLDIIGISYSQTQSGAYALILGETEGRRRLPIIIGGFEAQAIAIELEKMKPSRPLSHDLFKNFAREFNINVFEVIIHKFQDGVFFAKLICESPEKISEIDSRTSDAVALAVRFNCPIFTNESVLAAAGIILDEPAEDSAQEEEEETTVSEFSEFSDEDLDQMLNTAVDEENYERASRIRDEISQRKKKKK